jgi:Tetratricopeptide repeat
MYNRPMRPAVLATAVAVVSLAAAAAVARADRPAPPPPTVEDVRNALADNHISEAHRLGTMVIAAHPEDPQAAYLVASTCMSMGLFDEGNHYLDVALAAHPDSAELHGLRASIAALRGDDATARDQVAKAIALDPAQTDAVDVKQQLDVADHYAHHTSPVPPRGSPAARVAELLGKLAAGASAEDIVDYVDPGILANAPASLPRGRDSLVDVLRGAIKAARQQLATGAYAFTAYEVGVDAPDNVVTVRLLMENRMTADRVRVMKTLFSDPQGREMIDPETRHIFEGLDPADRDSAFDRMIGSRRVAIGVLEVPVVNNHGVLQVADFKINGTSLRDTMLPALPGLMAKAGLTPTPVDDDRLRGKSSAYKAGYRIGQVVFPIVLIVVIVSIVRRRKSR